MNYLKQLWKDVLHLFTDLNILKHSLPKRYSQQLDHFKLVGNPEPQTDMYSKGQTFATLTEKKKGEERRNTSSVGRMLEYKLLLRRTRTFLKRMTLRLPKSVNKVRNYCKLIINVTNFITFKFWHHRVTKKNLRNQFGLCLSGCGWGKICRMKN